MSDEDAQVTFICESMGVEAEAARRALRQCNSNMEAAIDVSRVPDTKVHFGVFEIEHLSM